MDKRVKFNFEIEFTNGGGLQGQDFRLDIEGDDISDEALAEAIVSDLRLLMVGSVHILNKSVFAEPHKRSRPGGILTGPSLVDLSHTITDGLITYKGLPAPIICDYLSREQSRQTYAPGTEFQIGKIEMVANTGTYVDCPFHRYADGQDLSEVGLERFADLEGLVVRTDGANVLDAAFFQGREIRGRAVLVHTGWDVHWNTPAYFQGHPHLTGDAAVYLRDCGVKLVGIDSLNIDSIATGERPVHSTLLAAGILIVEHLCNLAALPDEGFSFSAIPPKVHGMGTFPVRAMARLRGAAA